MKDVLLELISRCAVKGRASGVVVVWVSVEVVLSFCGVFDASTSFVHTSSEGVCRC